MSWFKVTPCMLCKNEQGAKGLSSSMGAFYISITFPPHLGISRGPTAVKNVMEGWTSFSTLLIIDYLFQRLWTCRYSSSCQLGTCQQTCIYGNRWQHRHLPNGGATTGVRYQECCSWTQGLDLVFGSMASVQQQSSTSLHSFSSNHGC